MSRGSESIGVSTPTTAPSRERSENPEPGPQPQADKNRGNEEPEFEPSDDEVDDDDFPISHELAMKDHTKVVTALSMEPSGARIVSGSHDYDCKMWDFGGMTMECKPFKSWEPAGSYPVCSPFFHAPGMYTDSGR